jgi:hypothetical protein
LSQPVSNPAAQPLFQPVCLFRAAAAQPASRPSTARVAVFPPRAPPRATDTQGPRFSCFLLPPLADSDSGPCPCPAAARLGALGPRASHPPPAYLRRSRLHRAASRAPNPKPPPSAAQTLGPRLAAVSVHAAVLDPGLRRLHRAASRAPNPKPPPSAAQTLRPRLAVVLVHAAVLDPGLRRLPSTGSCIRASAAR